MDQPHPAQAAPRSPRSWLAAHERRIRLASGLVLAAFLVTHFGNHALGLVSVAAMEEGRGWFNLLWRSPAGTALLYGGLLVHFLLALQALHRRRTLRMPAREAAQLAFGLALPFLLVPHVTGTRIELAATGRDVGYPDVLRLLWVASPEAGARQALTLLIAWLHGCLGVYFWLRPKPWFGRAGLALYTAALVVPLLALLGFAAGGQEVAGGPEPEAAPRPAEAAALLAGIRTGLSLAFAGLIAGVLASRAVRFVKARSNLVRITYPAGRTVAVPRGFSLLEASRIAGIPHVSVCGGRGRCSTCRVVVTRGLEGQPAPAPPEQATLARFKAGPEIRLACQLRPVRDISVRPVLSPEGARGSGPAHWSRTVLGQEREIAVLFCDLRGFTGFAERRLPYDTVFILNRYFAAVGEAVDEAGGRIDKFVGDGALALFGLDAEPDAAARQAVDAALRVRAGLAALNDAYRSELDRPLRAAIALHLGPAVVGEMGYGAATGLTAVGDTLNAASRLEGLAKSLDAELVISDALAGRAGLDLAGHERRTVIVRGRDEPLAAWIVRDAGSLASGAALPVRTG